MARAAASHYFCRREQCPPTEHKGAIAGAASGVVVPMLAMLAVEVAVVAAATRTPRESVEATALLVLPLLHAKRLAFLTQWPLRR